MHGSMEHWGGITVKRAAPDMDGYEQHSSWPFIAQLFGDCLRRHVREHTDQVELCRTVKVP